MVSSYVLIAQIGYPEIHVRLRVPDLSYPRCYDPLLVSVPGPTIAPQGAGIRFGALKTNPSPLRLYWRSRDGNQGRVIAPGIAQIGYPESDMDLRVPDLSYQDIATNRSLLALLTP